MTDQSTGRATATSEPVRPSSAGGRGKRPGPLRRLALFYREVVAELRKVIWPTRKELVTYTSVVVVFVTMIVTVVGLLDIGFAKLVLAVFG